MSDEAARVSALYVYPVKSCRGIRVERAEIGRRGFVFDRRYMIVDDTGRFVTQRQEPRLCRVATALDADAIHVESEGLDRLDLPHTFDDSDELEVSVWKHVGHAVRHAAGSAWFSALLERPCSLVYMPERHERPVDPKRGRPGDIVSFADGYPFLVISEASLGDLNSRLTEPLEMRRFRPNIVVSGVPAFAEDGWTNVALGDVHFRAVKRCDRCVVTTLDPDSGEGGKEPLRTLAKYRLDDGKVWFGMNLIHDGPGFVAVGDAVQNAEE